MGFNAPGRVHFGAVNLKPILGCLPHHEGGAAHIGDLCNRFFRRNAVRHFHQRTFGVAIQQQVGFGVNQDGAAHLVLPIVVMRNPPQRRFDATDDDWHFGVGFSAPLTVNQHTAVRSLATCAAGRVGVIAADFAVRGVAVDHGIHVASGHAKKQIGLAQSLEGFGAVPLGLRDDAHAKTLGFQHAPNDGHAKTRVVHIGVARDQNDVATVPAQLRHFGAAHRQKRRRAKTRCPVFAVAGQGLGGALKKGDVQRGIHQPSILVGGPALKD